MYPEARADEVIGRLSEDNRRRLASLATATGRGEEELAADLLADALEDSVKLARVIHRHRARVPA
jgi:hypothetical protein